MSFYGPGHYATDRFGGCATEVSLPFIKTKDTKGDSAHGGCRTGSQMTAQQHALGAMECRWRSRLPPATDLVLARARKTTGRVQDERVYYNEDFEHKSGND